MITSSDTDKVCSSVIGSEIRMIIRHKLTSHQWQVNSISASVIFMILEVFSTLIIHIMVFLGYDNIRSGWYVTLWVNVLPTSSVQRAYSCGHTLLLQLLETIWCHNPEDYSKNIFEIAIIII